LTLIINCSSTTLQPQPLAKCNILQDRDRETHRQLLLQHTITARPVHCNRLQHKDTETRNETAIATHCNRNTWCITLQHRDTETHNQCSCNTLQLRHLVHCNRRQHRDTETRNQLLLQHSATATPGKLQQTATQKHRNSPATAFAIHCNCNTWYTATHCHIVAEKLTTN